MYAFSTNGADECANTPPIRGAGCNRIVFAEIASDRVWFGPKIEMRGTSQGHYAEQRQGRPAVATIACAESPAIPLQIGEIAANQVSAD